MTGSRYRFWMILLVVTAMVVGVGWVAEMVFRDLGLDTHKAPRERYVAMLERGGRRLPSV